MSSRLSRLILVVGFALFMVLPVLEMRFQLAPRSDSEKRARKAPPALSLAKLETFPKDFEAYVKDEFGFRDLLIKKYSLAQVRLFHRSSVPNVIIGDDGWLFYAGYNDGAEIAEFQGKAILPEATLAGRKDELANRATELGKHGIKYVFALAPNKHTVYEEHLPARIGPRSPDSFLDQFVRYLQRPEVAAANPKAPFLDLRTVLLPGKGVGEGVLAGPLYYKTDTHWNRAGAYLGYRAIMEALGLPPLKPELLTFSTKRRKGGDLANMLALADDWDETEVELTVAPHEKLPLNLFVVGDSYVESLEPFLHETFASVVIHRVAQSPGFSMPHILAANANVVLDERVERYLLQW